MSNKNDITDMCISMGFERNYIERAFKVYEDNYGDNYNIELITEIIIRFQKKDEALKSKRNKHSSKPRCVCGIYLTKIKASNCYIGSNSILCNECMAAISGHSFVYNCSAKKNRVHERGYDLCENCAIKTSGFRHKHINEWTCKELQAWIISLCIGNVGEKKIVDSIAEQEITGPDFNSMEEVSDVMDSFEVTVSPAIKIYAALEQIRAGHTNDPDELQAPPDEVKQQNNHNVQDINQWDVHKLQQWIWKLNLNQTNAKKVADVIYEQQITGEDLNYIQDVSEIMDSFEIQQVVANKIWIGLEKLRGNIQEDEQPKSNTVSQEIVSNINDDDDDALIIRDIVVTKSAEDDVGSRDNNQHDIDVANEISEQNNNENGVEKSAKVKHKMKGKLAAKFGHLNIDPTRIKPGAAPPKRKVREKQQSGNGGIDESIVFSKPMINKKGRKKRTKKKIKIEDVEPETQQISQVGPVENVGSKTYEYKSVKNWNNKDLLDWIKSIGLMSQWQEIMVGIIESKGCTGNDWFDIKSFKQLAKIFDIKQTMLANRVFREFRKAKQKYMDKDIAEEEVKQQNVEQGRNIQKEKRPKRKPKAKSKPKIKHVWEEKDINKWTCDDLQKWIKSLDLSKKEEKKVTEAICEQEVCGEDFNSIEEVVDIQDALEIDNDCAMKIMEALEKLRNN